jgi:biofilm PGA synthesis N-glycosyltransferase PgaC
VDDGSTDRTDEVLRSLDLPNLTVLRTDHVGKAGALNEGLKHVTNAVTVCIDADTYLYLGSLRRIVSRLISDPPHTAAVAGAVMVRNSRSTFWTRVQEWDYFIGIASVKRQQSLYQGTLVAQGAFSAFRTEALRAANGWPPVIGEDIVMTWSLLKRGWRVGFEATAIAFTTAPEDFHGFWRQRQRWARGMIEGLKTHGNLVWNGRLSGFFVAMDFVVPVVDLTYTFAFLPGVLLALTGRYYVAGPMTLFVVPIALAIVLALFRQQKKVYDSIGLKVRRNNWGFVMFVLAFQAVMSPVSVTGYFKETLGWRKRW